MWVSGWRRLDSFLDIFAGTVVLAVASSLLVSCLLTPMSWVLTSWLWMLPGETERIWQRRGHSRKRDDEQRGFFRIHPTLSLIVPFFDSVNASKQSTITELYGNLK